MPTRDEINQKLTQDPVFLELSPEEQRQVAREAYTKFGAGDPVKEAKQHLEYGLQPKPDTEANAIDTFLKQAAIPTVAAGVGTALGAAVGGPIGATAGTAIGSGLGEFINQQVGITPENPWAVGLSTILPPALKAGAGAIQRLPRFLPGAGAALQEQAAIDARALPSTIKSITPERERQIISTMGLQEDSKITADALYKAADAQASAATMKFPKTERVIANLKDEEVGALEGLQDSPLIARLRKMEGGLKGKPAVTAPSTILDAQGRPAFETEVKAATEGGLSFDEFDKTVRNLGRKIGGTQDDTLKGTYKLLFRSLLEDVETMQPPAGVPLDLWKDARKMYRKDMARQEFAEMIETTGIKKVGEMLDQVNPNAIANWMKSPKQDFWRKSLEPGELSKIDSMLKEWATIPTVPVKRGQPIGSGRKLSTLGAGSAIGAAMGDAGGAAIGAIAADVASEQIARALTSDQGRKVLMKVLRASGGKFGQEQASMMGAFLAGGFGDDVPNMNQAANQ